MRKMLPRASHVTMSSPLTRNRTLKTGSLTTGEWVVLNERQFSVPQLQTSATSTCGSDRNMPSRIAGVSASAPGLT